MEAIYGKIVPSRAINGAIGPSSMFRVRFSQVYFRVRIRESRSARALFVIIRDRSHRRLIRRFQRETTFRSIVESDLNVTRREYLARIN